MSHLKSGKLRPLGISSAKRSAELPDLPTIAEAGVPGYDATQWLGLAGPKGLPQPVVERLLTAVHTAFADPELVKGLRGAGGEVFLTSSPKEFLAFNRQEAVKWARVVKESGAQVN
jgi:tripartite-type tricarboxylate transporter receptor subunit TctC